jgi:O-antigen/teichoic acid export membrane protein
VTTINFKNIKEKYIPEGSFISYVITLMFGTVIAQALPILISPILTRMYSPKDFGVFTLFTSVTSIVSIIATARYELAIVLPEEEIDSVNILVLSLLIALCVSTLALLGTFFFNKNLVHFLHLNNDGLLYLIPISVLAIGTYQSFNYWLNRKKRFKDISISKIAQSSATAVTNLSMGFWFSNWGLILGGLIGQITSTGILIRQFLKKDKQLFKSVSIKKVKEQAYKYRDFPRINSIQAFVDVLQQNVSIFLISAFFGDFKLGLYSFALRITGVPLNLIGSSVAQVLYQKASDTYNKKYNLQLLIKQVIIRLSLIAIPLFIISFIFAPQLFSIIFGAKWKEAGIYVRVFSPWIFLNFIVSPFSQIPIILNKQKKILFISLIGNLLILLSIFWGGYIIKNILLGFCLLSILQVLYLSFVIYWIYNIAK